MYVYICREREIESETVSRPIEGAGIIRKRRLSGKEKGATMG